MKKEDSKIKKSNTEANVLDYPNGLSEVENSEMGSKPESKTESEMPDWVRKAFIEDGLDPDDFEDVKDALDIW